MRITVTDEQEKNRMLQGFAFLDNINLLSLKEFSQKSGYGDDYMVLLFKDDLKDDEYSFSEELKIIKDNQVIFMFEPPASEVEENLYLDFDEFYNYLAEVVKERIEETPEDKAEYEELLGKVKVALGV